jgi:sterol desaturase/sphingolipid hydroxylase (fatty acid hydroxylase superfamily)
MSDSPALLLLGAMAVLAAVETAVPFRPALRTRHRLAANLGLAGLTLALNLGLGGLLLLDPRRPSLPALVLGVALLDLSGYAAHRLLHHLPVLWRVHRVHHADAQVDVTTAYRQHPVETLVRFGFLAAPAWALGLPAITVVVYRLASGLNALLEHANVELWPPLDEALSLAVVTPAMHKVHHSRRQAETDSNYGNILAMYDRVLGTFTPARRAGPVVYGLDGHDGAAGQRLGALLRLPFRG